MLNKTRQQIKNQSGITVRIISNFIHRKNQFIYKRMIKLLDLQATDRILEIGSSLGITIGLITSECVGCEIYGIETSEPKFIESVKRNKQSIDAHKVHLSNSDFMNTTMADKTFDKVFCNNLAYFGDSLQPSFEKIKSLLKDEGTFYFFMKGNKEEEKFKFSKKENYTQFPIEQIVTTLKAAGFKKVYYFIERGYFIRAVK